ncbi:MAG: hypothetical protein K8I82_03330 [Anaerolineae bacterium]|nr:hypothetical protein [Anaerolineae bacterium]
MWQFQVFDDHSEAISNGILGSMAFLRRDEHMKAVVDPILTKNGLENLKMDEWVPFQSWLNVFKEISAEGKRQMFDLVAIGMAIGMGISLPPEIDNIPAVLASLDPVYRMHHRGADVGHYHLEQLGERQYKVVANIPYPEDLVYGTIYGFCKRFVSDGDGLIVVIDKNAPSLKKGDKSTTYLISW